jgi:hypothetical protein
MKALSPQPVVVVAALPTATTALAGAVFRLSTDNKPYWCTGSAWLPLGPQITVSASAPSTPAVNDLWLDIS